MRIVRVNGPTLLDPTAGVVAATVLQGAGTLPDGKNIDNMATLVLGASALKVQGEGCLLAIATVQAA